VGMPEAQGKLLDRYPWLIGSDDGSEDDDEPSRLPSTGPRRPVGQGRKVTGTSDAAWKDRVPRPEPETCPAEFLTCAYGPPRYT
jgi:hypothetical protein